MKISSKLLVLSIEYNIRKYFKAKRPIKIDCFNVYKLTNQYHFDRSSNLIQKVCDQVYNDIENHFYSYKDLALFIACEYLHYSSFNWKFCEIKNINKTMEMFTEERMLIDQQLIIDINQNTKFEKLSQYFKINKNGQSLIYELITNDKKFISPLFFLKYEKIAVDNNVDLPNEDYLHFVKATKLIKTIITTKL